MRLDKFLADCGIGTRSEIKKIIKSGAVRVCGIEKIKPETSVDEKSEIYAFGKKLVYKKYIYLMLNKPDGYVSATWDKKLPVVLDLVPEEYLHFQPFPVGRLDIDTEGLLILTNNGKLSHWLLSPKHHIPKCYYAKVEGEVKVEDGEKFLKGVVLDDGYKTMPAELKILNSGKISEIELTISEGKFHQVKRMFEAVGKKVVYLKRIKMNELPLDESLENGDIKELSKQELLMLCGEGYEVEELI